MSGVHVLSPVVGDFKLGNEISSKQSKMEERNVMEHQTIYEFAMSINVQVCKTLTIVGIK